MLDCDLITKGGITSGVVYPHAIIELAKKYRLRNIGGTSAGAIAAVFAAAAEYRRQSAGGEDDAGFEAIGAVATELGSNLEQLFQPTLELRAIFELLLASTSDEARCKGRTRVVARAMLRLYRTQLSLGAIVAFFGLLIAIAVDSVWLGVLSILVGVLCFVVMVGHALWISLVKSLPANDFGMCPGLTLGDPGVPGFSDWIADKIDLISGNLDDNGKLDQPLTVGQLAGHGIAVASMTTDLSSARPYQLPLQTNIHYFSKAEFERLFPERIIRYLCDQGVPRDSRPEEDSDVPKDLYQLPAGDDFPLFLVARMSLSFPGLISAVPLYRFDYQVHVGKDKRVPLRRCLFSDGGISSNFPIHFFDALLPGRPTFGITLGAWDEDRHGSTRVHLPERSSQSTDFPVNEIKGVGGFLSAILNTAKDWQDSMQSLLPGYAERIVTVRLDESREGGINLSMSKETIMKLAEFGREAGQRLTNEFCMDQHRYDRAISLLPELEASLAEIATAFTQRSAGAGENSLTYEEVLTEFETAHYKNSDTWRRETFARFAKALADIGQVANDCYADDTCKCVREGNVPSIDSKIRLIAIADRVPQKLPPAGE